MKSLALSFLTLASLWFTGSIVKAADPQMTTLIAIEGMHCQACANKVAKKLAAAARVADAKVDIKTGQAVIIPMKGARVSPRALWEAVESSGYSPTRLAGPDGVFSTKPNS